MDSLGHLTVNDPTGFDAVIQAGQKRVEEFTKDHPELIDSPSTEIEGQGELFGEEEAGHKRQPYEMSAEEFIHDPGVWWHGTSRSGDVNRFRKVGGEAAQGTHLGTLDAASTVAQIRKNQNHREAFLHPVRVAASVLPTSTQEELNKEYWGRRGSTEGTETPDTDRGIDGMWRDQGNEHDWDAALDQINGPSTLIEHRTAGLIYHNAYEDQGSISATVPDNTPQTVADWIKKGMAEHPERVHPSLQHWVDTTGGSVQYNEMSADNARRDRVRPPQKQGQIGFDFNTLSGDINPPDKWVSHHEERGDPMHDSIVQDDRMRRA